MNGIIQTFLLALLPIGELRAAIPVGIGVYHLNWVLVFIVAVLGNLLPAILLLLFLKPVSEKLSQKSKACHKFFTWLFQRTQKKAMKIKEKNSSYIALAAFVAVPLPLTGAWTGSIAAFLLGMPIKKAFLAIVAGVLGAGIIVTAIVKSGIAIEEYFGWQTLIAILLLNGLAWPIFKKLKNKQKQ